MKNVTGSRVEPRADVAGETTAMLAGSGDRNAVNVSLCRVCRSPKRHLVDAALANRATGTAVATQFGFSKSVVYRHRETCLPARVAKANADREDRLDTGTLIDAMQALQAKTEAQLDAAIAAKNKPADVAKLIREVRENVVALGRFIGAFAGEGAKNVDNRVQVLALRDMTVDELRALTLSLRGGKQDG